MKILLTGAKGFTGYHFEKHANLCGHDVIQLKADITSFDSIRAELSNISFDAVVHLAGISFVGHQNVSDFYSVNVVGTTNLLDALIPYSSNIKSLLIASSANVYGNCSESPIKETQPFAPANHYAAGKVAMELLIQNYLEKLPIFKVRPFNYTGIGQDQSFIIPKLVSHFKRKEKFIELGNIDVKREFNDVRFVCDAYLKLLNKFNIGDVYNVCSNKPMSLSSVIDRLTFLTDHKIDIQVNPLFVRSNEIHRLSGDNHKLTNQVGDINQYSIDDTLRWMLSDK